MAHTPKTLTLDEAVESITDWAYSDSRVELDDTTLRACLKTDHAGAGRYPNALECEQIICGNEEGEIPEELDELFPKTMAYLETHW